MEIKEVMVNRVEVTINKANKEDMAVVDMAVVDMEVVGIQLL